MPLPSPINTLPHTYSNTHIHAAWQNISIDESQGQGLHTKSRTLHPLTRFLPLCPSISRHALEPQRPPCRHFSQVVTNRKKLLACDFEGDPYCLVQLPSHPHQGPSALNPNLSRRLCSSSCSKDAMWVHSRISKSSSRSCPGMWPLLARCTHAFQGFGFIHWFLVTLHTRGGCTQTSCSC